MENATTLQRNNQAVEQQAFFFSQENPSDEIVQQVLSPEAAPHIGSDEFVQSKSTSSVKNSFQKNYPSSIRGKMKVVFESILENPYYTILMAVITVFALFGDDVRVISTNKNGDQYFYSFQFICLGLFSIEILLSSLSKEKYFLSFFFWLDLLSVVSMIFDIGWIDSRIFGLKSNPASATQLARAGRASKIGTKAGRIIRIIRLMRLVKLYKHAQQALEREAFQKVEENIDHDDEQIQKTQKTTVDRNVAFMESHYTNSKKQDSKVYPMIDSPVGVSQIAKQRNLSEVEEQLMKNLSRKKHSKIAQQTPMVRTAQFKESRFDDSKYGQKNLDDDLIVKETKVGQQLTDLTTRRVITIVMSVLFSIPIFTLETYYEDNVSFDNGVGVLYQWKNNSILFQSLYNEYTVYHSSQRMQLIYFDYQLNSTCCQWPTQQQLQNGYKNYLNLRDEEKIYYQYFDNFGNLVASVIIDISLDQQLNAILSIIRTIFVTIVMSFSAVMFSKDVQDLVLTPIENMIKFVQRIAQNPLEATQMEENKAMVQTEIIVEHEAMETVILEKLIVKIGALLALGFGEAGSEIIAENMSKGGEVDPMIQGKRIMAIFGFCDIRNFTDATEVLQREVMVFVNEIAEIVHGVVHHFSGSANKNIGDAFLLVWKFKNNQFEIQQDENLVLIKNNEIQQLADMAILSFIKVISTIVLSKKLKKYKDHEELNRRLPNYQVKMGFGLHIGWAIEGAIGSDFKIDASYLSPNVNMASRLEAATKYFGSFILISGQLRDICSPHTQQELRQIDRVTVKGSQQPIGILFELFKQRKDIYTVDAQPEQLLIKNHKLVDRFDMSNLSLNQRKKLKVINRIKRDRLKRKLINDNNNAVYNLWQTDRDIVAMRSIFTQDFYSEWKIGFNYYISGDWKQAQIIFNKTYNMLDNHLDGPSLTLLQIFQNEIHLLADWKGYRELTEK